jgi:hypothetical protein
MNTLATQQLDAVAVAFREALAGKHGAVVGESLSILRRGLARYPFVRTGGA